MLLNRLIHDEDRKMEYLKVNNAEKIDVMRQLKDITNSGELVDKVLNFLQKHNKLLEKNEHIIVKQETPKMPSGVLGMIILKTKYSINIKKSTIVIIAFLLDVNFSKGITSLALNLVGFSPQVLQKITDDKKCLVSDVLIGNKKDFNDFNYYNKKCIHTGIECPFRDVCTCKRTDEEIRNQIEYLKLKQIIKIKDGFIKQTF